MVSGFRCGCLIDNNDEGGRTIKEIGINAEAHFFQQKSCITDTFVWCGVLLNINQAYPDGGVEENEYVIFIVATDAAYRLEVLMLAFIRKWRTIY